MKRDVREECTVGEETIALKDRLSEWERNR